jgi:signal transduction histidine kinase
MLQQAYDSSQRMVYLIADLLNASRLRSGKFVIMNRETFLPDVITSEVDQLKAAAQARKVELTFTKPSEFPKVMLDETKIRQVVMNFLDNALYYTPSGGRVNVELKLTDKTIEYSVSDTGMGVPKNEQDKLFTKFYRAANARKMRPEGTGLGLYMAKKVVVAQGGAIIFKSVEGRGSVFGFVFPRETIEVKGEHQQSVATVPQASAPIPIPEA